MKKYLIILVTVSLVAVLALTGCATSTATAQKKDSADTIPTSPSGEKKVINDSRMGKDYNQFEFSKRGWTAATGADNKYNNDDHYSSSAGSYYQLKFIGTQVKVFGTTDAHHGSAMVSIDGVDVKEISFKDSTRAHQILLFDSGELAFGEHVIRVTAVGDGVITADKIEVME